MVIWTQQSGIWSRLSGLSGQPSSTLAAGGLQNTSQFVNSRPTYKYSQQAVDFDRRSKLVYWSTNYTQSVPPSGSLSLQPLADSFQWNNSTTKSIGPVDWTIGSIAIDWQTGTVYVTAKSDFPLIGIVRYDRFQAMSDQPYRILFSSRLGSPVAVAVDPDNGSL